MLLLWSVARSPAATAPDDVPAVERLLAHDPDALLIAHFDGLIVGTAVAAWDGWRGHIYRLVVLPDDRLRGVGRRLVASGHERLRALGATRVNAAVSDDEPGPIAFWEAIGYRRDPGMSRFAMSL
ncbi:MAG: GNAT family N-acetyltransferase [Solirubrobacterales bacterium]